MKTATKKLKDIFDQKNKDFPALPGVYLFKDENNQILYIGKAKNLKKRVSSYFKEQNDDYKVNAIIESSSQIDYMVTKSELEAMLLEADLIQSNQPKFNILLKTGQPFLYLLITSPKRKITELKIVRNKKEQGTYFGPFLEKTSARKVLNFLTKIFRLKLCKKKIENGCLDYHMGICAGQCKSDFDKNGYIQRLELAKVALKQGHQKFLKHLKNEIEKHNKSLEFEKSKELNEYHQAFGKVFQALDTGYSYQSSKNNFASKDIWILTEDKKILFLFSEKRSALKKKMAFYFNFEPFDKTLRDASPSAGSSGRTAPLDFISSESQTTTSPDHPEERAQSASVSKGLEHFLAYYRSHYCPNTILINFDIDDKEKELYQNFLKEWHQKEFDVSITKPEEGHFFNLIKLAKIHAQQEIEKQKTVPKALKTLLKLTKEPHTIDCFDISHKQGMWQVGSCIRFKDGKPDKDNFRRFKIKTVKQQDDYACLHEIVKRRYKDEKELPDLILIDGGKGQLNAVKELFPNTEFASLAKREETVFAKNLPEGRKLNIQTYPAQLLIALRDYTHHFAISYHKKLSSTI